MRTYTDLATMEGANEAARRAVNCIIKATNSKATPCQLWDLHEPDILRVYRWYDKIQYEKGLPWATKTTLPSLLWATPWASKSSDSTRSHSSDAVM